MTGFLGLTPLEGAPHFGEESFWGTPLFPETPGLAWFTQHHFWALVACAAVIVYWLIAARRVHVKPTKFGFLAENLYGLVRNGIARDILGHEFRPYLPYLLALFSFITINNLFGIFALTMFPTFSQIGWAYALALCSFILYNAAGIKKWGFLRYMKKMTIPEGVPWFLVWLILPLELLSNFVVRPLTLALRLFANMFAGHLVVMVFVVGGGWLLTNGPVSWRIAGGVSLAFSLAIFALELLVAVLQSYIFTVLTAQYVSSAIAEGH